MKKTLLRNYARLIAVTGANVQRGQEVVVSAQPDQPEFVAYVTEACYRAGAARVRVDWDYQPLLRSHVRWQSLETLSEVEAWELERLRRRTELLPAMIHLTSEDPDGLLDVDQAKYAKAAQARFPLIKPMRDAMENKHQWCVAAVPGPAWARKVFPGVRTARAVELLWSAILRAARADGGDPVARWRAHNEALKNRCDYLNALGIETLEFRSARGTDLRVGLIPDGIFMGGGEYTQSGVYFNANIPTEEIFTAPMRGAADGIVYATRPLSYRGRLIEDFFLRFENGRVVHAHAEKNDALLQTLLQMDAGASYLGECALVPYDSPIRSAETLFYNTLFDENAACHLALGAGYTSCIRDCGKYTLEECRAKGVNDSMLHVDFMIGSADLSVTARTREGQSLPIFRAGNWAVPLS